MSRSTVNIYKIARECGVRLQDARQHSPASRRPFDCFCKPTVREIGERFGEGHLRLVFNLICGSKQNGRELYADVMKAVSRLIAKHPELIRRPSLVDDFNAFDLGAMRRGAKNMRCDVPTSDVLLVLLSIRFGLVTDNELNLAGEAA
ncbi:hypothetical protein ASE04_09720 [Rhizobium sp. Root708]|uniref:hypothetical protein n=1 Tax=Rhizobium sp. Root708 TaxID=1736592 RepID=UPI0006FF613D|nr:hypothetical protein [Rhizobium sp. Root708]KRB51799.1 hypothetical protein ASE04_09720 [Rhizobium sp. Root708]